MNPNYLLKDELQYQLLIRGIKSEAEVQTLRMLLRSANVAVNVSALSRKDIPELIQTVVYKVAEIQTIVAWEQSYTASLFYASSHKNIASER
jgi:hypothetical protein